MATHIDVFVPAPHKTPGAYVFDCPVKGGVTNRVRFGFQSVGWDVPHAAVWDTILPLLWLTGPGGPLFFKKEEMGSDEVAPTRGIEASIVFDYPVDRSVCDFFEQRCKLGYLMDVKVSARTRWSGVPMFSRRLPSYLPPSSSSLKSHHKSILALGNGKDSRLLYGLLREIGKTPAVFMHGLGPAKNIDPVIRSGPIAPRLSERLFAPLMHAPEEFYIGVGSGEATYTEAPWRIFQHLSSIVRTNELSEMLIKAGAPTRIRVPLTVLPYNIIQKILCLRYPDLYAGQVSTAPGDPSRKNFRIAVMKLWHGFDPWDVCPRDLFETLLLQWVKQSDEKAYGVELETRGLIWQMRDEPEFRSVRDVVDPSWDQPWIHYVHEYVNPECPKEMLDIFYEYAPSIRKAPPGTYRIPVPPELERPSHEGLPSRQ
jgi:hypothetical protein